MTNLKNDNIVIEILDKRDQILGPEALFIILVMA